MTDPSPSSREERGQVQGRYFFMGQEVPAPQLTCERRADGWLYRYTVYLPRFWAAPKVPTDNSESR